MQAGDEDSRQVIRRMRWLTVALPAAFLLILLVVTVEVLARDLPRLATVLVAFSLSTVGIVLFSRGVFAVIERLQEQLRRRNRELERRTAQLQAVYEAGLQVTANLSLGPVLQSIVDSARKLVQARYAALAVVEEGWIKEFMTSGISDEARKAIGEPPRGHGLLGHVLRSGQPYRSSDMAHDPHSVGFPPNHPPMKTFLGVPIISGGRVIGDLYLTDEERAFTDEDEEIVKTLAVQAAIAIENAHLYQGVQEVSVLKERERIAMDLHDGAIQSLYGVGLKLESCMAEIEGKSPPTKSRLDGAIEDLNAVIRRIRSYIFDLRPDEIENRELQESLSELLRELSVNTLVNTQLVIQDEGNGNPSRLLSAEQARQLYYIAREALTNVLKHARASNVRAEISLHDGKLKMSISDDGLGLSGTQRSADGQGLHDMQLRAQSLGGELTVQPGLTAGTVVTAVVPVEAEAEK
ncbi:MAG TPA: GAF domain-containing protein [Dehalococcoidia bacterium]